MPEHINQPLDDDNKTDVGTTSGKFSIPWFALVVAAMLLIICAAYWFQTRLPEVVRIAGGPQSGRYAVLAEGLATELRLRLRVDVEVVNSEGSLKNLEGLETGEFHFGLYQSETQSVLNTPATGDTESAAFVSNLYPEYLVPIGPTNREQRTLAGTDNKTWSCNDRMSGDYAATQWLMDHVGIDEQSVAVESIRYINLNDRLSNNSIDISILCCGLNAPILKEVLCSGNAQLQVIPSVDAFAYKHPSLVRDVIPAGFFQTEPPIPAEDFQTVVLQAQLLANSNTPVKLVEEATRIILDPTFQRRHGLIALLRNGADFAEGRSEFRMHAGAAHIFNPELKPLINPDFVEGTEGLRSFVVSILVAAWLARRWWKRRQILGQEHRLDRYIHKLLQLEVDQLDVDGEGGVEDSKTLQLMLDKVTMLRQEALSEFTAHELSEDRAVDCFVQMCHALSDKINGKLTRNAILRSTNKPDSL